MLCRFPALIKSFDIAKFLEVPRLPDSDDVLLQNVGDIIGGSMRSWANEELFQGYKCEGIETILFY